MTEKLFNGTLSIKPKTVFSSGLFEKTYRVTVMDLIAETATWSIFSLSHECLRDLNLFFSLQLVLGRVASEKVSPHSSIVHIIFYV